MGNWPGVTVEKKTGTYKKDSDVKLTDLPGIYSLSPYTLEEVVSRDYLLNESPDVIIDVIDGSNIERNLYLATQLSELGIPLVLALNKMDEVRKNKDSIDTREIEKKLNCKIVEISATKNENIDKLIEVAKEVSKKEHTVMEGVFSEEIEDYIHNIQNKISSIKNLEANRWYAIKLFEEDEKILEELSLSNEEKELLKTIVEEAEEKYDDSTEGIITDERYDYVTDIVTGTVKKGRTGLTTSDKIDQIVTNKFLALPIFAAIMIAVYYVSISIVGGEFTDWFNEDFLMGTIAGNISSAIASMGVADWVVSLIYDGIFGGVFAVIGFLPIIASLFFFIAILEDIGYMSRIAFILDRAFRRFGLSGKSFIPILIGTGCSVPGIIGTRTIESENDRRMTIMVASFMPCGAKTDIIAMFGAILGGAFWYGPIWYFGGILAVIITGVILKKTKLFYGDPAPFIMELPEYHLPNMKNVIKATLDRCKDFLVKAGTIILMATVLIWVLQHISINFEFVDFGPETDSILSFIGKKIAFIFEPLGFGNWVAAIASFLGLIAKEIVVGTFGVLSGIGEVDAENPGLVNYLSQNFNTISIVSFMFFNQLTVPCFAALGAIRQEIGSTKYFWMAVAYQLIFSYTVALMIYQFGIVLFMGAPFTSGTIVALVILAIYLYLIFRPNKYKGMESD